MSSNFDHSQVSVLRIRDVYPVSWFFSIPDPGSKNINKREGWKKFVVLHFFVATKIAKLKIILIFELVEKKFWANLQRITELLPKKLSLSCKNMCFGSGTGKKTYSGSRILVQGSKRHRFPYPEHCRVYFQKELSTSAKAVCNRRKQHFILQR